MRAVAILPIAALLIAIAVADAAEEEKKERSTGLPRRGEWTFNFDAGAGAFGFDNSLYAQSKPDPSGDLSDNWLESYLKPALTADIGTDGGGAFFGKVSGVGERTFSAPPSLVGESASSFHIEDAYLGWRSGTKWGAGEDAFRITLGRAPYELGHGLLVYDGAGDGGSRGGYWSGARKAWEYAGIARFSARSNTLEAFYLDRDELPENDSNTKLWGINYELALGEHSTIGLSYIGTQSDTLPLRDDMDVVNVRAFVAPMLALEGLSLELEYALEDNADVLDADAWSAQASYTMSSLVWSPQLTYRYAFFEGDDPATPQSEAFDSLYPGFYDWGTWWQGEIGGEYFLSNSNLISHLIRLHLTPGDSVSGGLMAFSFFLDQPASFAAGVTSDEVAFEIDGYVDWSINDNFTASFVLAYAEPDAAIEEGFGRTETMTYGMVYLSYSY